MAKPGGIRATRGRRGGLRAGSGHVAHKKHGKSFTDRIPGSKIVANTLDNLKDAAVNMPAGVYEIGKATAGDARDLVTKGDLTPERLGKLGKTVVTSTAQDLRHPLRNPGYTLLDLLTLASAGAGGAARVSAAARTGRASALVKRPMPGERTFKVGGLEAKGVYSKSALTRAGQRASDKRLHAKAEKQPAGRAASKLVKKAGKALEETRRIEERVAQGEGAALVALGRKLKPEEQMALRVVAEEAPVAGRLETAISRARAAKGLERRRHMKRAKLLKAAAPLLDEKDGKPVFRAGTKQAKKLQTVYAKMGSAAKSREELLKSLDLLTDEAIQSRKTKAGRVALGQSAKDVSGPEPPIKGQLSLIDTPKAEGFEASADAIRIPDVPTSASRAGRSTAAPRMGGQGTIGHPRTPGSLTHEYSGGLRRHGEERLDTSRLVGESNIEAERLGTILRTHEQVRKAASETPRFADDVAVRLDNLDSHERMPLSVRKYLDDPEEFAALLPDRKAALIEQVRSRLFIDPASLSGEARAEFGHLHAEGKIGWVPRKLLGDLAKNQAPLEAVAGRVPVRVIDATNNASRFAIFYLKPAYATPNILGNAALNILQQGWAAPKNLRRAVLLHWKIGPELSARIDSIMGEGFAQAVKGDTGMGTEVVQKAANFWSKGVDKPFRRSSFLYEAGERGYKTPKQIEKLLTDDSLHSELVEISKRANREIIDYARMSARERQIVRRVVFIYPWLKGSTVYAGSLLADHPIKAGTLGQLAREGQKTSEEAFGDVPSYLEGLIPYGEDKAINPASAAIINSPAQIGQALAGLAGGDVSEAAELSGFGSPVASLVLAEIMRRNPRTGIDYSRKDSGAKIAYDQLVRSLPQHRLYEGLTGRSKTKLFPTTPRSALEQYLIGSIAPREINRNRLRQLARREQRELEG